MAKTNKIAHFIKGPNGFDRPTFRNGQSKSTALYLLELRSRHANAKSQTPRRRLVVTVDPQQNMHAVPKPVKIVHS